MPAHHSASSSMVEDLFIRRSAGPLGRRRPGTSKPVLIRVILCHAAEIGWICEEKLEVYHQRFSEKA